MKTYTIKYSVMSVLVAASLSLLATGCKSSKACCAGEAKESSKSVSTSTIENVKAKADEKVPLPTIRIKAGVTAPVKDSNGNQWLADTGFADGETMERPELKIEGTKDQVIYQAERYGMSKFSQALPNGKYTVKLHFAETYDGISGTGQRVFSFNVEGHDFKDFDVWARAGGGQRAYVETVPVDIADGHLDITFTSNIENPEINGIEILPAP